VPTDVRFLVVGPSEGPAAGAAADAEWRDALLAAFWRYERALLANDLDTLDELFLDDPATLRGDAGGVLVGHEQISLFRRSRGATTGLPATRNVEKLHVQVHGPTTAVVVAEIRREDDGGYGLQTQVWVAIPAQQGTVWRVAAAQVHRSPAAQRPARATSSVTTECVPDVDPVWRLRGEPLVAGADSGPLKGLSVAVKDLFAVAGHRTGAGNPAWLAESPRAAQHATAVARLLDAGAEVTGLAQTDELAYSLSGTNVHYGTPPNPTASGVVPGGSSSGPASAVALGLVDVGLGTDTGGSVRVPASYCGLCGIRPTHGAVPATGVVPLAPSFDTVGWLTRSVETLAQVGEVLLPPDTAAVETPTELLFAEDLAALAEPEVATALAATLPALAAAAGLPVRRITALAGGRLDEWVTAFRHHQGYEANQAHGTWFEAHRGALGPGIAGRFAAAAAVTPAQFARAQGTRAQVRATLDTTLLGGGAVLVMPASSSPAPRADLAEDVKDRVRAATLTLTCPAGHAGLPVVVLPLLWVRERPVGLALVGARGSDRALLALATRIGTAWPLPPTI
jgi:Asp-tRNA(Asn)/Glu-tRNA(Gln) amidotransferase A subunit family amidase